MAARTAAQSPRVGFLTVSGTPFVKWAALESDQLLMCQNASL